MRSEVSAMRDPSELGYRYGENDGQDILLLRAALLEQPWNPADLDRLSQGAKATFPIKAADLIPEYEGPQLGKKLNALKQRWIDSGFTLTRKDLLAE
jgi:poly(A) polymerase